MRIPVLRNSRKTGAVSGAPRKEQRVPFPASGRASAPFALFRITASLTVLAGTVLPLRAGTFSVNPVRVELSARQLHTTLQIANAGEEKLTVQVHPMSWGKGGDGDVLEETNDVIVNPPIFTVAPHQTQFVRLGMRQFKAQSAEQTYRLILEEVPPPLTVTFTGLRTLLRISIPIFVAPLQPAQPSLTWEVRNSPGQGSILSAQNNGTAHIQLKQLAVSRTPGGEPIFTMVNAAYVLPGGRREWRMDGIDPGASGLLIRALTDHGVVSGNVAPSP